MFSSDIKNIKSTEKELKSFGLSIGLALVVLAGFLFWKEKGSYFYFLIVGNVLVILSELCPGILKPLQKPWMMFVVALGWLSNRIILSIIFYLVVSPIGLILRLFGKNFLDIKIDKSKFSYWNQRNAIPQKVRKENYEKQF